MGEDQPEVQEKLEKQITGSDSMWESQAQMEHITGKLTHPENYRPKSVILKEKRKKEKALKAKIREELLGTSQFSDSDDFRLYSDTLAGKAEVSKSEI
jgi:hypothetical protein